MEHLLKSSAVIALFYLCYKVFLQRETFFAGNRWFLLFGLLVSVFVSFIVIPIYVESVSVPVTSFVPSSEIANQSAPIETSFDYFQLVSWLYLTGIVFYLGKFAMEFLSLFLLIKKHPSHKSKSFTYIETTSNTAPFSFFRWIVYNPNQFHDHELNLILKHERVHALQGHSVDVIFAQLACAFLWFNPFVWLYKKALQQNLEFIEDQATQTDLSCQKSYQTLLLKTSISNQTLTITNNFYNSLIKKRIVMLHKSKSKKINAFKYALVFPLLVLFVFNFNTELVAQTKEPQQQRTKTAQNVLKYVITKDTKDTQLESIKEKLAENNVTITFDDLKRNDRKEIIGITINYESKISKGNHFVNSENPIGDIEIALNVNENNLMVGQVDNKLSQSFEIIKEDGETKLKKEEDGGNVFVYSTDDEETDDDVKVVGKDGDEHNVKKEKKVYVIKSNATKNSDEDEVVFLKKNKKDTVWIKKDVKTIVWTDENGHVGQINTSENGNSSYTLFNKGEKQPLFIVDGKTMFSDELSKINPNNIESVNVLKGEKEIESYGEKGKNGVIIVTTKNNTSISGIDKAIDINGEKSSPRSVADSNVRLIDDDGVKSISLFLTKITSDSQLDSYKNTLEENHIDIKFSKIKRNKKREITSIQIELKNDNGKQTKAAYEVKDGIGTINFGIKNGDLFIQSEK
ncbi:MAG: M56 family metallopeptidase [Aquaticitalea sp.]